MRVRAPLYVCVHLVHLVLVYACTCNQHRSPDSQEQPKKKKGKKGEKKEEKVYITLIYQPLKFMEYFTLKFPIPLPPKGMAYFTAL